MKIAVSILSSIYDEETTIKKINQTDAEYVHVDVMDNSFVLGATPKREFLHQSQKPLDVHLMVSRPFEYIAEFAGLKAKSITIHVELEDDLNTLLDYIKSLNIECGLALNPETPTVALEPYLEKLDEVLVMLVTPGKGGQAMQEDVLYKIDELKEIREKRNLNFQIIVDGGVNGKTVHLVKNTDVAVSGSFICKSEDYQGQIDILRKNTNK